MLCLIKKGDPKIQLADGALLPGHSTTHSV